MTVVIFLLKSYEMKLITLKLESLEIRRNLFDIIMTYKLFNGLVDIDYSYNQCIIIHLFLILKLILLHVLGIFKIHRGNLQIKSIEGIY